MMQDSEKVLTQAEIDALLSGGAPAVATGPEVALETPAAPAAPVATAAPAAPAAAPPPSSNAVPAAPAPTAGIAPEEAARIGERLGKLEESVSQAGRQGQTVSELENTVKQLQQSLQELTSQLQAVGVGLQGTVGFAARDTFVCNSCSTKGNVAARLTCTSCGTENWWGWYPQ